MAKNENFIQRTAFATFDIPNTVVTTIADIQTDAFVPAGAIVTGIRFLLHSETAIESLGNITLQPNVGAIKIGHDDVTATALLTLDVVKTQALTITPVYIGTGGYINLEWGSSAGKSDVTGVADVYVDYIYCGDRDKS